MAYTNKTAKTQAKLENSLLKLMENNKFESITVGDITALADVNRSTFYRHYLDKYEVLEKIEDKILTDVTTYHQNTINKVNIKKLDKNFQINDYINENNNFFIVFKEHLPTIKLLLSTNGSITFRNNLR